jgi:Fe-Mn family superoxide dismutase
MIATFTFKPRSWNLSGLNGISDATLETHFGLYEGYVKNTNLLREQLSEMLERGKPTGLDPRFAELQRRLGFELGGMRLHELYFDNLTTDETELVDGGGLHAGMVYVWGSVARWRSEFAAMGEMRGVGWVILAQDPWTGSLSNHWVELHQDGNVPGYIPILVMDVWEHAWIKDYAPKGRAGYVEAFLSNVDWHLCEERMRAVYPEGVKTP